MKNFHKWPCNVPKNFKYRAVGILKLVFYFDQGIV
ncbi:MAG: hypothetical protein FKGGLIKP_00412 [Sodalis sp. Fse]|nr:MAG: hypothetical protein FKGGLIKP_00412 [Sodalis sp. Fse]